MSHGEILIVAHLKVESTGVRQLCGLRAFEHVHAVGPLLNPQADPEFGIAADLVIDNAGGLLGCQNQMDAQTSADTGSTDELFHKLRLLLLQLREFVGHDKQMGHGFGYLTGPVELLVGIDVHGAFVQLLADPAELLLTADQFTLDRHQGALDGSAVQIGDGTSQMRQAHAGIGIVESIGQATTLVVDQNKGDFMGVVVHRQGENVGDNKFGLAGAGHTGHQTVGALPLFVQIQHEDGAILTHTHRGSQ